MASVSFWSTVVTVACHSGGRPAVLSSPADIRAPPAVTLSFQPWKW